MNVTLFTRAGCHLCEAVLRELAGLQRRYPHTLQVVDITSDPRLEQQYGERIPVLHVGGAEYSAPLPRQALERALRSAARSA
jgi:hypothetical protein